MADSEAASKHEPTTDTALTNDSESAGKDGSRTDIAETDDSKSVSKDESQTETAVTNYSKVTCLPAINQTGKVATHYNICQFVLLQAVDQTEKVVDQTGKVATHYNQLKKSGLERTKSRIFYMRNFNNWIKSMAINDTISRIRKIMKPESDLSVLDLCSGKGGDLLKWKGQIDRLVCTDIASISVEQSKAKYKEMLDRAKHERRPVEVFKADFITADCTKQRLRDMYPDPETTFDLVSCQFSFHYGFESHQQAKQMIQNACECLRPGGYFLGTTPNSNELVKRLSASDDMSFGNEVYSVGFETDDKAQLPLFGAKYNFHLEDVVDCPEFLVHFPLVEKMAAEYGMKLVYKKPFAEFFDEHIRKGDGRGLIGRMQCLEVRRC
ncbi:mRNA cap guanine-N7 methyltransferase [Lamellibrachia satsuma]|nr:mRNA cap guanine-N7 methyltransferase [Lamellibrachia satsuma]